MQKAMSTVNSDKDSDLEKKFFDLVVQPSIKQEVPSKPPQGKAVKHSRKLERKPRHVVHLDRHRFLIGNQRLEKKEPVKSLPVVEIPKPSSPIQIALTPNPSSSILQCRILHEITDVERSVQFLKTSEKEIQGKDTNLSEEKLSPEPPNVFPQVVELGLVGVFELIRETASQHDSLCCKALQALLNMLQGQKLEGMKNESPEVLDNLFQTLMDLTHISDDTVKTSTTVTLNSGNSESEVSSINDNSVDITKISMQGIEPGHEITKNTLRTVSSNIPSLACSCLLSLALAWGKTEKLLSVIATFIANFSNNDVPLFIKVPDSFIELQRSVLAALLEKDYIPTPLQVGIKEESTMQVWGVDGQYNDLHLLSMQCDGSYLYALFSNSLLLKIGTGYNTTVQGYIYKERYVFDIEGCSTTNNTPQHLFYFEDSLYCMTAKMSLCLVHRNDLSVKHLCNVSSRDKVWFCENGIWSVVPVPRDDTYVFKTFSFDGKSLIQRQKLKVRPTKQHLMSVGKMLPFNPIMESSPEKDNFEIIQVLLGCEFALLRTDKGQVFYAGKSEALGLKGKGKKALKPEILPLTTTSKIVHIAVAPGGNHAILISETGEVYFTGASHRGEDGEMLKGRRQPPSKAKVMKCVEGKHVVSGYCNSGTSALITKEGKLYLFGKDSTQADSKTGLVSALNDVHVEQVALGKAHVVIMSDDGRLWTAGVNNRGQCGRQEGVMSITQRIAEVESEKDVSMPEDKSMEEIPIDFRLRQVGFPSRNAPIAPICSPDKHKWKKEVCMICAVCCECTGYGSNCINSSVEGRFPGMPCGCGAGWSGCSECGCCKTCAGEADVDSEWKPKEDDKYGLPEEFQLPAPPGRSPPFFHKLAAFFHQKNSKKGSGVVVAREHKMPPSKSDILKEANKMALLPLLQIHLPKMGKVVLKATQIACGDHHTVVLTENGSVYAFGKNNHGQLGLGNTTNKNQPTHLELPYKVKQLSCGSHHTLFLSDAGLVYGCGSNSHGQLVESNSSLKDVLAPMLILSIQRDTQNPPLVSWISASSTSSFFKYEEVLLSVEQLEKAKIFAGSSFVGIRYKQEEESKNYDMLLIDRYTSQCQHSSQGNFNLRENEQVCVDAFHDVLWSFDASDWSVKSYMLSGYKQDPSNPLVPFAPQLSIPLLRGSLTTRTQAGLNLLSCINTLVTNYPQGVNFNGKDSRISIDTILENGKTSEKSLEHSVDEYNAVCRFKSHGGGWGYSVHSTEAIRFMADADVILGGIGVFGGRGEYTVSVAVYEEVGDADGIGEGELLVETDRVPYECGFREKFHVLFDDPVPISSGQWYTVTCKISGPSSDCGSHGEQHVVTSDNIKFTFRRSKRSNNGTDVSAGQIPELLYSLPVLAPLSEVETRSKPNYVDPVQTVSTGFYKSLTEKVFDSLPFILEWARVSLFEDVTKKSCRYDDDKAEICSLREKMASNVISNLSFTVSSSLRLLRETISQLSSCRDNTDPYLHEYAKQNGSLVDTILNDGEIDQALFDILQMPSSDCKLVMSAMVTMLAECHAMLKECIGIFRPTPPQKWSYLYEALENYSSVPDKARACRMLVLILDALCQKSVDLVQCLPLFPRTLSNLESVTSPSAAVDSPIGESAGFYQVTSILNDIVVNPVRAIVEADCDIMSSIFHDSDHQLGRLFSTYRNITTFENLLLFSDKSLIVSVCKLLSTLTSDLAYRASDTTLLNDKEKTISTVQRFDRSTRSWDSGNGTCDAVCFYVDVDGVSVDGFGVYGGGNKEHRFELLFSEKTGKIDNSMENQWEKLAAIEGTYGPKDCGSDHIFTVKLTKPIPIKKKTMYAIQFYHYGEQTYCGENGKNSFNGSDGTTFYFSHCSYSTNGTTVTRGQIPTILYHRSLSDEDLLESPGDQWVGTTTTPTTAGLAYQRHALNIITLVVESAVEILNSLIANDSRLKARVKKFKDKDNEENSSTSPESSSAGQSVVQEQNVEKLKKKARAVLSSKLISDLLPELFFHISVLVRQSASCAVEVMELVYMLMLPLITVQQMAKPAFKDEAKTYSQVVQSSHPYKPASVEHYKVKFTENVKWMLIEFSPKSQTAQPEDFLHVFLGHPFTQQASGDHSSKRSYPVLRKMSQDKNWPQNAVLLPGHEITFILQTASDYTNSRDQKPHIFYGFRCVVTGYESVPVQKNDGSCLVSSMINAAGLASNVLMKAHDELFCTDEEKLMKKVDSAVGESRQEKIEHLKAIERTALMTLQHHDSLFLYGLHLDFFPGSGHALSGNLPISESSKEKMFLHDFVSATHDTSGGRLARWLQPDSYIDPKHCSLQLNVKSLFHSLPTAITIITKDQYGNPAYVPTLKVELSAKPVSSPLGNNDLDAIYDQSSSEPSPVFETPYEVTKHKESRYHAISMMRSYKKFSFEELRVSYPLKRTLKTENVLVAHVGHGTYRATWIPAHAATYSLQVTLDDQLRGPRQQVVVAETPLGCSERPSKPVTAQTRLLRFTTRNSRGLRIRSSPTLQSMQVGLLEYFDVVEYCDKVENSDGDWVKLSTVSIDDFCKEGTLEAWCIQYHKHNGRIFLEPVEPETKEITEVDKKLEPEPGIFSVSHVKNIPEEKPSSSKSDFSHQAFPSAFSSSSESKTDIFKNPFLPPPPKQVEWVERIPGEYKVAKCGKSGHNIRYNPNLKAAPIGKLVLGNLVTVICAKKNKTGTWLLLHKSAITQYCVDVLDARHAWTLAVSIDGTQHLQLREIVDGEMPQRIRATAGMTSTQNKNRAQELESVLKITDPFSRVLPSQVSTTTRIDDDDAPAEFKLPGGFQPTLKPTEPSPQKTEWLSRIKKHTRSSSESDVVKKGLKKKESKTEISRGRPHLSNSKSAGRSQSNPDSKQRTSQRSNTQLTTSTPRKTLVERQTISKSKLYPGVKSKVPPEKAIRGGKKKASDLGVGDDIPFIDDVVDAEGNILSPTESVSSKPSSSMEQKKSSKMIESKISGDDTTVGIAFWKENLTRFASSKQSSSKVLSMSTKPRKIKKTSDTTKALSPVVAECSRAVFAAFLWHEGIVHDAMACASFLKFNRTDRTHIMKYANLGSSSEKGSQRRRSSESSSESVLVEDFISRPPETLVHLAMFWDRLSETVTKIAVKNPTLPTPTPVNENLNWLDHKVPPIKVAKRSDAEANAFANGINEENPFMKIPPLKRKASQRNLYHGNMPLLHARRVQGPVFPYHQMNQLLPPPNPVQGEHYKDAVCELCDKDQVYPITYHMKVAHPGCGKFAGGLGYNSSGHYCGGWAGDCGDGGVGGSTWYLLCVSCREKYLAKKKETQLKKIEQKPTGSWMNRLHQMLLQPSDAHQIMKENALFLLNFVSASGYNVRLYEQKGTASSTARSELEVVRDEEEIEEDKLWDRDDLFPHSTYSHCHFPAIQCAYLTVHGKENGINNNLLQHQAQNPRPSQEVRNRSLSNQATPSSGHFKHFGSQKLSMTPESTPQKTESFLFERQNKLMRSVSSESHPHRRRTCSGSEIPGMGGSTGSFLLHNPSASMKRLMQGKSDNCNNIARDAVHGSCVLPFVTQRHDLKSLLTTFQITLRRAALRVYALQALTWLLRTVVSESSIHDILWYFVSALAGSTTNSKNKENKKEGEVDNNEDEIEETKPLYMHPVKDLGNAGFESMMPLVEAFHGFLQTVSDVMMELPPNSPVQLMAVRCWSLRVLPSDHQFLHNSKVFSHISQMLSKVDTKVMRKAPQKLVKVKLNQQDKSYIPIKEAEADVSTVSCMRDLTASAQIKTSSHPAIANSLTDGSTETFWESGEEDKNKIKSITLNLSGLDGKALRLFVHIDNTRDIQKKVTSVSYLTETDEEWTKQENRELNQQFVGWTLFVVPPIASKLKLELRGPDNGLRVRQVKLLGYSQDGPKMVEQLPTQLLRAQTCEAELLKVFKLLTAEVFGQLLSDQQSDVVPEKESSISDTSRDESKDKSDVTDVTASSALPVSPRDVDPNLREHMVGILFSRSKLTTLQKRIFKHTVQAIRTETSHLRKIWEMSLESPCPNQPKLHEIDTYCFELLSMILALSGSDVGCCYVAQHTLLFKDFISLLHTGTPRIQRQVTLLLRRVFPKLQPLDITGCSVDNIPSLDEKLSESCTSESQTSLSSSSYVCNSLHDPLLSILDPLFACIAKSVCVQVKGVPESLASQIETETGSRPKRSQTIKLQSAFPGRPASDSKTWWMHGTMQDHSTAEEIIKLLTDMTDNDMGLEWCGIIKCSVAELVLDLTRLSENDRDPEKLLKSATLWKALAALCVLDEEHVEKLTSARSNKNKNKNPQEISSFDVRSREFQFAGHRWYVYTGKPNNEYFSFYLRIVNLGKDVRVHTVYSFNVINLVNYQNNYSYHSPPSGRVFSRDDDALSWGWKEFIRRETLLKPNGGFFFDGNKVLVELECKSYKTVFEESIELPKITQENPFPMIHTSPFSVGGFAWQIRIFPDGPDVENKGNVALFLHCTTSNHLAKVKTRFLIESQPSPAVYEHTFPANCISEMPSGVAFPNKGEFMNTLKNNHLKVGVVFLSVTEVNEVHVTLSEPATYPTVCVTPFEDLSGCPWVLKTLQATKLKLKMDQNEKTTSGLMEFYHRHVTWNATLVSPESEDVSLNVPLNTKGPLLGYFGENWSDADVIKSDLTVEDLASTDNPYRTDVDDGYDRYSYISIHVELVSNHLLYKTPAPSPTADRERKLLYNARKDRTLLHGRYHELLRQKALLESKCNNLTRERTRLVGDEKKDHSSQIVPGFSKFLFDVMTDLAQRSTIKGNIITQERTGRPYVTPPKQDEAERLKEYSQYRENFSLLVLAARPDLAQLSSMQKEIDRFKDVLVNFIQAKAAIHVTQVVVSGSLGMKTACSNRLDVDFILMSTDLPRIGHVMWLPSFVVALTKMLEEGCSDGKLEDCSEFTYNAYAVQFKYKSIEVDLYPVYDWQSEGGFDALYEELLKQRVSENLSWFCPATAERQKLFIEEQPIQVKDLIMVVKFWRNAVDWGDRKWRPSSYLLSLLLVRAYENACHVIEGTLPSNRTVLKCFLKLVLSTADSRLAPMRISWGRFYDPKDYNIEYTSSEPGKTERPSIIQDPANPANNVAEYPLSWATFRRTLDAWGHDLGLMEEVSKLQTLNTLLCENHDDGSTLAIVQCNECGNLCSECDRYLHLHKRTRSHQRQIFKEEEEAVQVNLHEGCGRIKLFWMMALADANTLKAVVEFKSRTPGQRQHTSTTGVCRFCGSTSDSGQLAVSNVCSDSLCKEYALTACVRTLPCGHLCGGVKDEETCLKCLQSSCNPGLNQDADDMCMICFTDALSAAPAIQLECGHIFHLGCCETQLQKQWSGARITFGFMRCSICKATIKHVSLEKFLAPLRDLVKEVERKALQRLEYEGLNKCESITSADGRFYNDPAGFALNKYAYYMCHKCKKAYYGGEVRCDAEIGAEDLCNPEDLICGGCSDISCAQICPKHGTDFLEYKCRYCCSVAVYFCFGTTHFCQPCHDDFQRITTIPKADLPHCPAGHKARQLEGKECPLHVAHPPTGEEFALGCGVCRNAHTF